MSLNIYILTYNRSSYLRHSIESVLNQTYKDFQLYILDNCSQDNTSEVVHSFCDTRLHYIRHDTNIGGYGNFNFAIDHCKADYFVLFHDDDRMLPHFIEKEISVMESDERIAAVSGNAIYMGKPNLDGFKTLNPCGGIYSGNDVCKNFLGKGRILMFPSLMYRTAFIKANDIHFKAEVGPCGDVVFYCDIGTYGGVIYELSDVIMQRRIHAMQDSQRDKYGMNLQLLDYFKHTRKYRRLFLENRYDIYARFVKVMVLDFLSQRMSRGQLLLLRGEFRKILRIKGRCKWDIALLFTFKHPGVMLVVYRIYCKLYRKPVNL